MIPRSVKRMFDERREPRDAANPSALIEWRGTTLAVGMANISPSGAMVICNKIPHIGEAISLQLADRAPLPGVVRWVRDGRIGIHFTAPLK
ncbi:MAG: PilZ domain-containing protein [Sphingomonas bacterium]|nr:PilZ domain-containing protein [Sphingomonas bacterium]